MVQDSFWTEDRGMLRCGKAPCRMQGQGPRGPSDTVLTTQQPKEQVMQTPKETAKRTDDGREGTAQTPSHASYPQNQGTGVTTTRPRGTASSSAGWRLPADATAQPPSAVREGRAAFPPWRWLPNAWGEVFRIGLLLNKHGRLTARRGRPQAKRTCTSLEQRKRAVPFVQASTAARKWPFWWLPRMTRCPRQSVTCQNKDFKPK